MLILTHCDAEPALRAAGIAAAERFFAKAGADPERCWRAAEAVSFGQHYDRDSLRSWYLAEDAAILAVYGRWRRAPAAVALEWRPDPAGENPSW